MYAAFIVNIMNKKGNLLNSCSLSLCFCRSWYMPIRHTKSYSQMQNQGANMYIIPYMKLW